MIETRRLKYVVIFIQTILSFVLSRKIVNILLISKIRKKSKSFLFLNATKIHQLKGKNSEIKKYHLCLGKISKDFFEDNMIKTGLNGYVYDFSVDYNIIDTSNIINIHKYLIKKHDIK